MRSVTITINVVFLLLVTITQAIAEKKVALVIGNFAYENQAPLSNPGRDAQAIGSVLQELGFKLVGDRPLINLDKTTIDKMVEAFGMLAEDADVALFYFSGHGVQVDGTNYLLPTDLGFYSATNVDFRALNANLVLRAMSKSRARLKMMLLDACRTNPFSSAKDSGGGLAQMQAPVGTVIGFATQPNTTASQGPAGGLSPYAESLSTYMNVKGLEMFVMLNEVGLAVMAKTKNVQQPWITASPIGGRFYFKPSNVIVDIPDTPGVFADNEREKRAPLQQEGLSGAALSGAALSYIQRATQQLEKKDYITARATLTEGIKSEPNSVLPYSYRGFAWYLEGQTKEPNGALLAYRQGFSDLDKAIRLDPTYPAARRHRGNTILATYKALRNLGKPTNDIVDRAIDDLKGAATLDPTSKANTNALGYGYLVKGSYRAAIESFNKAIELDRSYAAPYAGLCLAYRMLGDLEKARTNAQLAANRDSDLRSKSCLTDTI